MEICNTIFQFQHKRMRLMFILLVCAVYSFERNKNALRVVGGRNASQNEFPYVVKIVLQKLDDPQPNTLICSSIVVTSTWTLTAAHCVFVVRKKQRLIDKMEAKIMIAYQSSRKTGSESFSEILSTVVHPNYKKIINDIGLLQTQPMIFAKYGKLSSVDYKTLTGQEVTLVGYGLLGDSKHVYLELPQVLEVVARNCEPLTQNYPNICFAQHCSPGKYVSRGVCPGDSGGPSIHASGIIGINTQGFLYSCIPKNIVFNHRDRYHIGFDIGISTPISPFLDWITSVIKTDVA